MINLDYPSVVFAAGLIVGVTLDLLLLRTLLAPPFRIWPTPEPGSWQSLTFWGLFRGGMVLTFVVAILDWNATPLLDRAHRPLPGRSRSHPGHRRSQETVAPSGLSWRASRALVN